MKYTILVTGKKCLRRQFNFDITEDKGGSCVIFALFSLPTSTTNRTAFLKTLEGNEYFKICKPENVGF